MSERMNEGGVEDRKMKRKIEEVDDDDGDETAEEHFLSLKLCNNADMAKPLTVWKPSTTDSGNKKPDGWMRKEFRCKYCVKDFKSSQALGGHQNAHRRERVLSKMKKLRHTHMCPCSSSSIIKPSRVTASSSATSTSFNNPHFHRLYHVPRWIKPKPGLSFGLTMMMMKNSSGNPNIVEDKKKPDVSSSSALDLSLRL